MNKHKLKETLKKELLEEISDDIVERIISILPSSVKNEMQLTKYSELYGKRNPHPDFNLQTIEQKAKEIEEYNQRHSSLTPPKPRDFDKELESRRKAIESIQEEHSDY